MKKIEEVTTITPSLHDIYKAKINHKKYDRWAKHVVGLANTEGGAIYFGVNKQKEICGVDKALKEVEFIKKILDTKINPQVSYDIEVVETPLKIIVLTVLKAEEPVYLLKRNSTNVIYYSDEDKTRPATFEEMKGLEETTKLEKAPSEKYSEAIISFCQEPKSRKEIQEHIGISSRPYFMQAILVPLLKKGVLEATNKNPRASNQKYLAK